MLESKPYDIIFVQKSSPTLDDDFLFVLIFKFFTHKKLKYIIRVEYFEYDVFSVKYYVARDRKREDKYYRLTKNYDAIRIFKTCASVFSIVLKQYPNASFCFNATRTREDKKDRIESQNSNQRFRLYTYIVDKLVGHKTFEHYSFEEVSSYLLVNKSGCDDSEIKKNEIRELFLNKFDFYDSI